MAGFKPPTYDDVTRTDARKGGATVTFPVRRIAYAAPMSLSKRAGKSAARKETADAPGLVIPPDANTTFEILRARKRPLSKGALHARAHETVTDLIWATCRWGRDWTLGDYRFLVLSTNPSEGVELYVQFWSEPQEIVCWEVSSGHWHGPTKKAMAGAPAEYVERLGFAIGGQAENFQREVWIRRRRDAAHAATVVLNIFYGAFGYRGLTPIKGEIGSDSRGEIARVHHAFTPEDLCKPAARLGWTPQLQEIADDDDGDPVVIDLRRGDARAQIVLSGRVPRQRLYQSAFVDVGDPLPPDQAGTRAALEGTTEFVEHAPVRVGRTLYFAGGVTADWLLTQMAAALSMARIVRPVPLQRVH